MPSMKYSTWMVVFSILYLVRSSAFALLSTSWVSMSFSITTKKRDKFEIKHFNFYFNWWIRRPGTNQWQDEQKGQFSPLSDTRCGDCEPWLLLGSHRGPAWPARSRYWAEALKEQTSIKLILISYFQFFYIWQLVTFHENKINVLQDGRCRHDNQNGKNKCTNRLLKTSKKKRDHYWLFFKLKIL